MWGALVLFNITCCQLHWLHTSQTISYPVPEPMKHSSPPLKKRLTSLSPLFTLSWMLRWFSNKIIAYNLSFSTPLPCKHGGDGNFHLALMYHFNMRIRVSNLSLMLMQCNMSHHGCWVLSGRCQLLDDLQVVKQQSAFELISALILGFSCKTLDIFLRAMASVNSLECFSV